MSRFLTESLGLCIALESARSYGWNSRLAIFDADRLDPTNCLYVSRGVRPDFVVQTPTGWHGVEARGRSQVRPPKAARPITGKQEDKLVGLDYWATTVSANPGAGAAPSWSMSWAWITETGTEVDHFDPGEPLALDGAQEQQIWDSMSRRARALTEVEGEDVRRIRAYGREVVLMTKAIQPSYAFAPVAWLTVAAWSERLTDEERRSLANQYQGRETGNSGRIRGYVAESDVGAFMASAITLRKPRFNDPPALLRALITR